MKKFKSKNPSKAEISTASLPDIVFLLLFFFMVMATIRSVDDEVEVKQPRAEAVTQIEKRTLIRELTVGLPVDVSMGVESRIRSDQRWLDIGDISQWVYEQRETLPESQRDQMIVMLRADEHVNMGLITDIQAELRKADARKILYRTTEELADL